MARKAVMDAVVARFSGWSGPPLVEQNTVGETPADGSGFMVLQYPIAREEPVSLGSPGSNVWREEGTFRVVMFLPAGSGIDLASSYSDQAKALFRYGLDDLRVMEMSGPHFDDQNDQGGYFLFSVSFLYQHDIFA